MVGATVVLVPTPFPETHPMMPTPKHSPQVRAKAETGHSTSPATTHSRPNVVISGAAAGHDTLRASKIPSRKIRAVPVAGLWIDRRKAILVILAGTGETVSELHSDVEHEPSRFSGRQEHASFEAVQVPADDRHQRAFAGHLRAFYERIHTALGTVHDIFLFGPGEAKSELEQYLTNAGPAQRNLTLAAVGGLSLRQIVAKVHGHFPA